MKKTGNILYWVILIVLIMVTASVAYKRMKPSAVEKIPSQNNESTLSDNTKDKSENKKEDENNNDADMAPDFSLEDMEGNKITLSDYQGKIVVLNFWATSCGYCVQEMPDLDKLNKKLLEEDEGIVFAVNLGEELSKIKKFTEDRKLTLPVLMDYDGSVSKTYRVSGIPVTYIIDKDGTLYGRILGATDYDTLMQGIEKIKK